VVLVFLYVVCHAVFISHLVLSQELEHALLVPTNRLLGELHWRLLFSGPEPPQLSAWDAQVAWMDHLRNKVNEELSLPSAATAATPGAVGAPGGGGSGSAINYADLVATAVAQGTLSPESAWLMRAVVPKEPSPAIPAEIAALWTSESTYDLLPVATRVKLMFALCCWRYVKLKEIMGHVYMCMCMCKCKCMCMWVCVCVCVCV
jgi:hypothetical protein